MFSQNAAHRAQHATDLGVATRVCRLATQWRLVWVARPFFLNDRRRRPGCVRARHAWLSPHERVAHALAGRVRPISYVRIRGPPAARLCAVNVTELAPSTRYGDCRAQHTFVFFIGQTLGPVVYGFDLRSAGITPALLAGALVLSIVPSLDERISCAHGRTRCPGPAPRRPLAAFPHAKTRLSVCRRAGTSNR